MTPVCGMTQVGVKTRGRDEAVAHCVDAVWAPGRSPLTDVMTERGIPTLTESLSEMVPHGGNLAARGPALVGA